MAYIRGPVCFNCNQYRISVYLEAIAIIAVSSTPLGMLQTCFPLQAAMSNLDPVDCDKALGNDTTNPETIYADTTLLNTGRLYGMCGNVRGRWLSEQCGSKCEFLHDAAQLKRSVVSLIHISSSDHFTETSGSEKAPKFDETQFTPVYGTAAGSPALLKCLAENEEIIYALVRQYLQKSPGHTHKAVETPASKIARSYAQYFEATTGRLNLSLAIDSEATPYRPDNVAWNPLSVYHLIKRFLGFVKDMVRNLDPQKQNDYALQRQILQLMKATGWPTELDLKETMSAILRIQHTYDLTTPDVASGILKETNTGVLLSPLDCNFIGKHAIETKYYALAVEWLERGAKSYEIPPYEPLTHQNKAIVDIDYQHAVRMHDETYDAHEKWEPMFFTEKVKDSPEKKVRRRTTQLEFWKGGRKPNLNDVNYWGVCSGENYQSEEQRSKLFCWYETESHPYWKINPLRAELLSYDPLQIVQYYNIIGLKMINRIKVDAASRLKRSFVFDGPTQVGVLSERRTSLNTWIDDIHKHAFRSIGRTVEFITGLRVSNASSSESLQVAQYSSGSHYSTHLDAFSGQKALSLAAEAGNRIATFIYYLSDVGKGGGTAFPQSGLATVPRKGSAVLWYNLLRSGHINDFSWHGSCPVILGEKWISNKWIRSNDQMFSPDHSCVPHQDAGFDIRVNGVPLSTLVN